jgi:hypothetical protein
VALPATDVFTGANGAALSASWTNAFNAFIIRNNSAAGASGADTFAWWNADVFGTDHYSKANITAFTTVGPLFQGVIARATGTTAGTLNCYAVYTDGASGSTHTEIAKITGGSGVALKAVATTFTPGDLIEIRCTGTATTTIAMYKNGVLVDSVNDSTSPFTSGAAGIYAFDRDLAGTNIDNWEGGNLGSSPATLSSPTPSGLLGTQFTATVGASTDQVSGTIYAVVDSAANLSGVTATQIKAGQKASGAAALASGNASVVSGTPSIPISGLTPGVLYSCAEVQNNTNGDSNVVTTTFTTAAAPPTLLLGRRRQQFVTQEVIQS